jgi:hypothetical protein
MACGRRGAMTSGILAAPRNSLRRAPTPENYIMRKPVLSSHYPEIPGTGGCARRAGRSSGSSGRSALCSSCASSYSSSWAELRAALREAEASAFAGRCFVQAGAALVVQRALAGRAPAGGGLAEPAPARGAAYYTFDALTLEYLWLVVFLLGFARVSPAMLARGGARPRPPRCLPSPTRSPPRAATPRTPCTPRSRPMPRTPRPASASSTACAPSATSRDRRRRSTLTSRNSPRSPRSPRPARPTRPSHRSPPSRAPRMSRVTAQRCAACHPPAYNPCSPCAHGPLAN